MNHTINLFKVVASIAVVLLHLTSYIRSEGYATFLNFHSYVYLLNLAVPLFFSIGGFFAYGKPLENLWRRAKKIFLVQILTSTLYIIFNVFLVIMNSMRTRSNIFEGIHYIFSKINPTTVINGKFASFHLWYLNAMALSLVIMYILLKHFEFRNVFLFSGVIYFFYLGGLIPHNEIFSHGGVIKGLFYTNLGYYVSKNDFKVNYAFLKGIIFIFLYSLAINWKLSGITEIFLLLSTYFFINFAKFNPGKESIFSRLGFQYSSAIYLYHIMIYRLILPIMSVLKLERHDYFPYNILLQLITIVFGTIILNNFLNHNIIEKLQNHMKTF